MQNLNRISPVRCNAVGVAVSNASAAAATHEAVADTWVGSAQGKITMAVQRIDARIDEMSTELELARMRRRTSRRLCAAMTVAAIVSSVVVIIVSAIVSIPVASALWVLPSAFGGSAVSQASSAMSESVTMRRLLQRIEVQRAARQELERQSRLLQQRANITTIHSGLRVPA